MPTDIATAESGSISNEDRCRLLELAVELQLAIYELVLIENEPLLLNCPCNSSYRGRYEQLRQVTEAWKAGEIQPPLQPALLRTCRFIRGLALPLFYSENVFRACYCHPREMLPAPIKWLRLIGRQNREMLRHLYFYDRNEGQDRRSPFTLENFLKAEGACEIFTEMEGKVETLSTANCCAHLVKFGSWQRKDGEVPFALQDGARRLRMSGER